MSDLLSIVELALYVISILVVSAAVTWVVVKISPSEAAKQQKAQEEAREAGGA
ncbi:MAG: hypothetical protein OEV72_02210 [Thermoleophilia bacterium]|nr:hypothetical protein [Thermoleophilia bacterium]MDH5333606.1 hypothetical protein [Thermoleophilia bacterium]